MPLRPAIQSSRILCGPQPGSNPVPFEYEAITQDLRYDSLVFPFQKTNLP